MGLFVINTVAPGGVEHIIPEYMLNKTYQNFERIIRAAYAKPAHLFELHLHYEKSCTSSNDVPPGSFNTFMHLNTVFSEHNARMDYYVCFIPKANDPPPQLPGTPVSEQEHFSSLSAVQSVEKDMGRVQPTMTTNNEQHLEYAIGLEASSHPRRAVTEGATSQTSGANVRAAHNLDRSTTKRPLASEDSVQGRRKQAKTIEPGPIPGPASETLVPNVVNPAPPNPDASSLEHSRKELPGRSIFPIKDGLPGSAVAYPIILEREHTDPEIDEQAYKFFASHHLPHPHQHRFKVGVINKRNVPASWKLDEGGRLNAVFVQLEARPRVSHFIMDEDKDGNQLKRPTINRVSLDMVNYDSGIQVLHNMNRLKDFLLRYNESLVRGRSFEEAQAVLADLGSCDRPRSNDEAVVDHEDDATVPGASKIVILRISPERFNLLICKLHGCTNCQETGRVCEPWGFNGYFGCKFCRESGKLCNLIIQGENGQRWVRAARPKAHAMEESDTDSHSSHEPEGSRVAGRETTSQGADSAGDPRFIEADEDQELYGLTPPPRSRPLPNPTNAEIPEQPNVPAPVQTSDTTEQQSSSRTSIGPRLVRLKISFRDNIAINDDSHPLNFDIDSIHALGDWTVSELVEKVLRERIANQIMKMGGEKLTSARRKDLTNADLNVHVVTLPSLTRKLFTSSDVERWDSWWMEDEDDLQDAATDRQTIPLVVYME